MLPFPKIFNNHKEPVIPPFGNIVFSISNLKAATGIIDRGPHQIPIQNPSNIQILEDAHGSYMNFVRGGVGSYLLFNHGNLFNYRNCEIKIVVDSEFMKNATIGNLNTLFDCSEGLTIGGGITIGTARVSEYNVSLYGNGGYYINLNMPLTTVYPDLVEITVRYDQTIPLSTLTVSSAPIPQSSIFVPTNLNSVDTYIGGIGARYKDNQNYQIKGKIYSVVIREKEIL